MKENYAPPQTGFMQLGGGLNLLVLFGTPLLRASSRNIHGFPDAGADTICLTLNFSSSPDTQSI
jgi:hypothetical protein